MGLNQVLDFSAKLGVGTARPSEKGRSLLWVLDFQGLHEDGLQGIRWFIHRSISPFGVLQRTGLLAGPGDERTALIRSALDIKPKNVPNA
jgi:hypothetical protein